MLGIKGKAYSNCSLIFSAVPIHQLLHIKGVMGKMKDARKKMLEENESLRVRMLRLLAEMLIRPLFAHCFIEKAKKLK